MSTASTTDREVILHVLPIRLRLEEVLLQEHGRITSKPTENQLRKRTEDRISREMFCDHRWLTAIHLIKLGLRDVDEDTYQDIEHV